MSSFPSGARDLDGQITRSLFLRRSAGLAASLSFANLLAGCGSSTGGGVVAGSKPPAKPTGVFRYPLEQAPTTFDIAFASFQFDYAIQRALFDRLVTFNDDYTALAPSLATSWEQSPDAREYVIHLRRGVRFHDGEPLDSTAVKRSLEYFQRATGSVAAFLSPPKYTSIDDSDPLKVRIVMPDPQPDFMRNLTFSGVMSPKAIARGGEYLKRHAIGSGAYKLVSHGSDGEVVVEANEDYWGVGPYFERVHFSVIRDPGARVNALLSGQTDYMFRVPPTQTPRVQAARVAKLVTGPPVWATSLIHFACNVPPFDDVRVRQAVAYAIDKPALIKAIVRGQASVCDTLSPKGITGYAPPAVTYRHDPERARQLLAEAGHPNGLSARAAVSLALYLEPELAQAIAGQLKQVGIDLQVDVLDIVALNAIQADQKQQKYHMFPDDLIWLTGGPLNQQYGIVKIYSRIDDPSIEEPLQRMKTTPDGPARQQAFADFEAAVSRKVPLVSLFQPDYDDGLSNAIGGYPHPAKNGYGPDLYPMYRAA